MSANRSKIDARESRAKPAGDNPKRAARQTTVQPEVDIAKLQSAVAEPQKAEPESVLALQRRYGNRAVRRLIQRKLTVGAAHDPYEQEADRVADQVVNRQAPAAGSEPRLVRAEDESQVQTKPLGDSITPRVQREHNGDEEEEKVQAKGADLGGSFQTSGDFEDRLGAARGGGSPLPGETREFMESRFGADFSGVRVHSGGESAQLNREVSAVAFTHGQDIYLGEGQLDLQSGDGKRLLAHELTHVVQQTGSGARSSPESRLPSTQRVADSSRLLGQVPQITQRSEIGRIHRCGAKKGSKSSAPPPPVDFSKFIESFGAFDPGQLADAMASQNPQFAKLREKADEEKARQGKKGPVEYKAPDAKMKKAGVPSAFFDPKSSNIFIDPNQIHFAAIENVIFETANVAFSKQHETLMGELHSGDITKKPLDAYITGEEIPSELVAGYKTGSLAYRFSVINEIYEWQNFTNVRGIYADLFENHYGGEMGKSVREGKMGFSAVFDCATFAQYYALPGKRDHRALVEKNIAGMSNGSKQH